MQAPADTTLDLEKASSENGADPGVQEFEPEAIPAESRSTAFLDGLRGLAAFLVYMAHQVPWWYGMGGQLEHGFGYHGEMYLGQLPFIRSLFNGGNAAVAIFFVLSGYVLSISPLRMLRHKKRRDCYRSLVSASIRRPLRLYIPPLGVSFTFALVMQLPFGFSPHLEWPTPRPTLIEELENWCIEALKMMNPFKKHGVYEPWFPYDPPAWTMAVELKGSMLVFCLIALFSFAPPRYALYLFSITGLFLFAMYEWSLACFLGGVVLALNDLEGLDYIVLKRVSTRVKSTLHHAVFFAGWFLLGQPGGPRDPEFSSGAWGWSVLTKLTPSVYYNDEYWRFYTSIGAFLLVYGVLRIQWLQRFLTTPTLLYLGRIAFSLYLIHIPFEWTVGDRIYRILGIIRQDFTTVFDNRLPIPDYGPRGLSTGFLISQVILLPINLFLAKLGTNFLDRHSVSSGKWLVSKLGLAKDRNFGSGSSYK